MSRFIELCEQAGLSFQEAASALNLSVETAVEYTSGARVPSPREIHILKGLALGRGPDISKTVSKSALTPLRGSGQRQKQGTRSALAKLASLGSVESGTGPVSRTAIDLFCGAGGLSEGFRQAGFEVLVGNDFDQCAGETFAQTHRSAAFLPGPIEKLTDRDFLGAAKLTRGELDVLIGGPPCQAFSVYNHQRGLHDQRSRLFREYLRIVEGLKPKFVVMENVTGITSVGRAVDQIINGLRELGYNVETNILRAEEYGVPQERRRIFFVGNRLGLPIFWPNPTHGPGLEPFVNVWDAIGDLPALANGEAPSQPQTYRNEPRSAFQSYLRGKQERVSNHQAPRLAPINLERMKHIGEGGSWRDLPKNLLPAGMKRARRSDHTKRYGRLSKDVLACTILTK